MHGSPGHWGLRKSGCLQPSCPVEVDLVSEQFRQSAARNTFSALIHAQIGWTQPERMAQAAGSRTRLFRGPLGHRSVFCPVLCWLTVSLSASLLPDLLLQTDSPCLLLLLTWAFCCFLSPYCVSPRMCCLASAPDITGFCSHVSFFLPKRFFFLVQLITVISVGLRFCSRLPCGSFISLGINGPCTRLPTPVKSALAWVQVIESMRKWPFSRGPGEWLSFPQDKCGQHFLYNTYLQETWEGSSTVQNT